MNANGAQIAFTPNDLTQYGNIGDNTVYYWDGKFNLNMRDGWFYEYDAENRLTLIKEWSEYEATHSRPEANQTLKRPLGQAS